VKPYSFLLRAVSLLLIFAFLLTETIARADMESTSAFVRHSAQSSNRLSLRAYLSIEKFANAFDVKSELRAHGLEVPGRPELRRSGSSRSLTTQSKKKSAAKPDPKRHSGDAIVIPSFNSKTKARKWLWTDRVRTAKLTKWGVWKENRKFVAAYGMQGKASKIDERYSYAKLKISSRNDRIMSVAIHQRYSGKLLDTKHFLPLFEIDPATQGWELIETIKPNKRVSISDKPEAVIRTHFSDRGAIYLFGREVLAPMNGVAGYAAYVFFKHGIPVRVLAVKESFRKGKEGRVYVNEKIAKTFNFSLVYEIDKKGGEKLINSFWHFAPRTLLSHPGSLKIRTQLDGMGTLSLLGHYFTRVLKYPDHWVDLFFEDGIVQSMSVLDRRNPDKVIYAQPFSHIYKLDDKGGLTWKSFFINLDAEKLRKLRGVVIKTFLDNKGQLSIGGRSHSWFGQETKKITHQFPSAPVDVLIDQGFITAVLVRHPVAPQKIVHFVRFNRVYDSNTGKLIASFDAPKVLRTERLSRFKRPVRVFGFRNQGYARILKNSIRLNIENVRAGNFYAEFNKNGKLITLRPDTQKYPLLERFMRPPTERKPKHRLLDVVIQKKWTDPDFSFNADLKPALKAGDEIVLVDSKTGDDGDGVLIVAFVEDKRIGLADKVLPDEVSYYAPSRFGQILNGYKIKVIDYSAANAEFVSNPPGSTPAPGSSRPGLKSELRSNEDQSPSSVKDILNSPEKAEVYIRHEGGKALQVARGVFFLESTDEMLRLIWNPLKHKEDILTRQNAVRMLIRQGESTLKGLQITSGQIAGQIKTYRWLFENDSDFDHKPRLAWFLEKTKLNAATVGDYVRSVEAAYSDPNRPRRQFDESEPKEHVVAQMLGMTTDHFQAADKLAKALSQIDDPILQQLAGELKMARDHIKVPNLSELATWVLEKEGDRIQEMLQNFKALQSAVDRIQAFLTFSLLAMRDQYTRADFDESKPAGYKNGWSFIEPKKAASNWSSENTKDQVLNDGPSDLLTTILTGSNMSGKSHYLKQNFFIQLLAQSFGYVPAQQANMRIYDHIAYVDRPSTHSEMNLSAFGVDAKNWIEVEQKAGPKSLVFVDEGFSTISPEDQRDFLKAANAFFQSSGARVMWATHNEEFIEAAAGGQAALYHFEVKINGDKVEFTHKLRDGPDDSHAIEVARTLNFQERVIRRAEQFLRGESSPVTQIQKRKIPPVRRYSTAEQKELAQSSLGFLPLFPTEDVLTVSPKNSGYDSTIGGSLGWRFGRNYDNPRVPAPAELHYRKIFKLFSEDNDFTRWAPMHKIDFGVVKNENWLRAIQEMIMTAPSADPGEILERQEMFKELSSMKDPLELLRAVGLAWHSVAYLAPADDELDWDQFNIKMLDAAAELSSLHGYHRYDADENKAEVDIFLNVIAMVLALANTDAKSIGIDQELKLIADLLELLRQKDALTKEGMNNLSGKLERDAYLAWHAGHKAAQQALIDQFTQLTGKSVKVLFNEDYLDIRQIASEIQVRAQEIKKIMTEKVQPISLYDSKIWPLLKSQVEKMLPAVNLVLSKDHFERGAAHHISKLSFLLSDEDAVQKLADTLNQFHSAYMQRFSRHLTALLRHWLGPVRSGIQSLEMRVALRNDISKIKKEIEKLEEKRRLLEGEEVNFDQIRSDFQKTIQALLQETVRQIKFQHGALEEGWVNEPGYAEHKIRLKKELEEDQSKFEFLNKLTRPDFGGLEPVQIRQVLTQVINFKITQVQNEKNQLEFRDKRWGSESFSKESAFKLQDEVAKFRVLIALAYIIRNQEWQPVELTDQPEIEMTDGWNIMKSKQDQVKLSMRMNDAERIRLLSGSTMSGKTFSEKTLVWNVLAGMATGFAPSRKLRMPVFQNVLYLDRVTSQHDRTLSAYGHEITYLKQFFELAEQGGLMLGVMDEAGSTTSPKYQTALYYAIAEEMLEDGHLGVFSSHNHGFLDQFIRNNGKHAKIYHFRTHPDEKGEEVFEHKIEEGHALSNSIAVAKTLGLSKIPELVEKMKSELRNPEEALRAWAGLLSKLTTVQHVFVAMAYIFIKIDSKSVVDAYLKHAFSTKLPPSVTLETALHRARAYRSEFINRHVSEIREIQSVFQNLSEFAETIQKIGEGLSAEALQQVAAARIFQIVPGANFQMLWHHWQADALNKMSLVLSRLRAELRSETSQINIPSEKLQPIFRLAEQVFQLADEEAQKLALTNYGELVLKLLQNPAVMRLEAVEKKPIVKTIVKLLIKPDDLLVDAENGLWKVINVRRGPGNFPRNDGSIDRVVEMRSFAGFGWEQEISTAELSENQYRILKYNPSLEPKPKAGNAVEAADRVLPKPETRSELRASQKNKKNLHKPLAAAKTSPKQKSKTEKKESGYGLNEWFRGVLELGELNSPKAGERLQIPSRVVLEYSSQKRLLNQPQLIERTNLLLKELLETLPKLLGTTKPVFAKKIFEDDPKALQKFNAILSGEVQSDFEFIQKLKTAYLELALKRFHKVYQAANLTPDQFANALKKFKKPLDPFISTPTVSNLVNNNPKAVSLRLLEQILLLETELNEGVKKVPAVQGTATSSAEKEAFVKWWVDVLEGISKNMDGYFQKTKNDQFLFKYSEILYEIVPSLLESAFDQLKAYPPNLREILFGKVTISAVISKHGILRLVVQDDGVGSNLADDDSGRPVNDAAEIIKGLSIAYPFFKSAGGDLNHVSNFLLKRSAFRIIVFSRRAGQDAGMKIIERGKDKKSEEGKAKRTLKTDVRHPAAGSMIKKHGTKIVILVKLRKMVNIPKEDVLLFESSWPEQSKPEYDEAAVVGADASFKSLDAGDAEPEKRSELRRISEKLRSLTPKPSDETTAAFDRRFGIEPGDKSSVPQIVGILPNLGRLEDLRNAIIESKKGRNKIVIFAGTKEELDLIQDYLDSQNIPRDQALATQVVDSQAIFGNQLNAKLVLVGLLNDEPYAFRVTQLLKGFKVVTETGTIEEIESAFNITATVHAELRERMATLIAA